jgi:hypothetical protein
MIHMIKNDYDKDEHELFELNALYDIIDNMKWFALMLKRCEQDRIVVFFAFLNFDFKATCSRALGCSG